MKRILIVDDEQGTRDSLQAIFSGLYELVLVAKAEEAREEIARSHFDLMILDIIMPGINGIAFLREVRETFPQIPVVMISASHHEETIQQARELKATGFVCKPFDVHALRQFVAQCLQISSASRQEWLLKREIARSFPVNVIGESAAIRKAVEDAKQASQTEAPVLIIGEAGTGREFFARQIHSWSRFGAEPFIKVECFQRDSYSLEKELFGSVANPPDTGINPGTLDLAGNGSIYLEDAQLLGAPLLADLKEAITHREFKRVDAPSKRVPHIARFFVSLKANPGEPNPLPQLGPLAECFADHVVYLPALRERVEDIPLLAMHYINQFRVTLHVRTSTIEPSAVECLKKYSWPGNIRELRNIIERILVLHGDEEILRADLLPGEISGKILPALDPESISFGDATDRLHRQLIVSALERTNGVVKNAAALLNVTPRILQHRMDKLGIDANRL
jgi:DNA-binding NtrC family response regulator